MSTQNSKKPTSVRIPELRLDILKAFGADLNAPVRENLIFVNKALCYPIGHHIALRDIYTVDNDAHKNDLMFIYLENEVIQTTSLNVSYDNYLLLVATEFPNKCEINVYNLFKVSFASLSLYQPKRKIISTKFKRFIYAAFSPDGNSIACIGENKEGKLQGLIYDIQSYQKFKRDNYSPINVFDLPKGANKITFFNKVICTSGKNHLSFWCLFENTCKEYKSPVDVSKNYVDHSWVDNEQTPTLITVTEDNEIIVFNALYEVNKITKKIGSDPKIERFCLKQSIPNAFRVNNEEEGNQRGSSTNETAALIFNDNETNVNELQESNDDEYLNKYKYNKMFDNNNNLHAKLKSTSICVLPFGIVVGTNKGNLLFLEKNKHGEYVPIRFTLREKEAKVTGITASCLNYDYLAISFDTNEIAYVELNNLFTNLKNEKFEINFHVVCEGFHSGPITTMDVAQQRPIIITTSKKDKTVRVWNYLTGHCEYCKIILEEKDNNNEKEMNILSVAIHPNGYYIAISDIEMIRFFHLCYKELRFYNNDQIGNEPNKSNCTVMKFSNGGHLLAAVSDRIIYLIRSYSRETITTLNTPHTNEIIAIYFHTNDNYLYSVGNDGIIIQYNLFDFNYIRIANKYINYTSSALCTNYYQDQMFSSFKDSKTNFPQVDDKIISCGNESMTQSVISTITYQSNNIEELSQCTFTSSPIDCRSTAICNIHTKRFDISSIAIGGEKGELELYSHYNKEINGVVKFDAVMAHRTKVNFIYFSRDTNLLFSAGDDGNLFIYAVYETPDGDNIQFDDNKNIAITQLNSILDEGLGDNVLVSLYELREINDTLYQYRNKVYNLEKQNDEIIKHSEKMLHEKELEINRKKETEINELRNNITDLKNQQEEIAKHYQNEIKSITNENKLKYAEREQYLNERITELNIQISEMKKQNEYLKEDFEKIMMNTESDYIKKFKEFEYALKKRCELFANKNELLITKLNEQETTEKRKIDIIETEHEMEIVAQNDRYQKIISKYEKEIEDKSVAINKLKDTNMKLELTITANESNLKKMHEDNERLSDTINKMRNQLDMKESEKETLTKKMTELEQNLQEKMKLEGFSNQLKNELYKKNFELNSKFNDELTTKEELKDSTRVLEKQLEETILLLINREKEMNKMKLTIDELKRKWDEQRHETNIIKKDYDNLLHKIYDTCQSNDKNTMISGIREIYRKYLSQDADKNFDTNKLNPNMRVELENQIDYLQGKLGNVSSNKTKNDRIQVYQYHRKMQENSMLIEEMSRIKKLNAGYVN